jgi:hypothetical protein
MLQTATPRARRLEINRVHADPDLLDKAKLRRLREHLRPDRLQHM